MNNHRNERIKKMVELLIPNLGSIPEQHHKFIKDMKFNSDEGGNITQKQVRYLENLFERY